MTYGSLFSGAGGFDLGFHRAGFDCLWTAEILASASDVLAKLGAPNLGDVTKIDPEALDAPDVVIWGSPCQDLSVANVKRKGLAGNKSGLFYEGIRIIKSLRARGTRFSVWENVAGAVTANDGRDFHAVIQSFRDIGAHSIGWRVLDGKYFGVPQSRRRVFIVADFGGDCAGEVLCDAEASRLYASEVKGDEVGLRGEDHHGTLNARSPSRWGRPDHLITHATIQTRAPGRCGQSPNNFIIHPAVLAKNPVSNGTRTPACFPCGERLRWRTPLESDRLMGWPDDWTRYGASGKEMSDAARYFMTGNGVIAHVAYWLAVGVKHILEAQHERETA